MAPPPAGRARASGDWQAHAGAVGFGGLNAVTEPLKEFPVKGFFLLEMPANDLARKWFTERKVKLEQRFQEAGAKSVAIWKAELWDPVSVARSIVQGMKQEGLDALHFNVSAGPNTVGVGATLASLFWDVRLYYAKADFSTPGDRNSVDGPPIQAIHRLPAFRAQPPRPESLQALAILVAHSDLASSDWKDELAGDAQVIRHKGKGTAPAKMSLQAIHGQFEAIVRPLVNLGLVTETWNYGRRYFRPTDQGRAYARLFDGLHDRAPEVAAGDRTPRMPPPRQGGAR